LPERPNKLPIIVDVPSEAPKLGFDDYAAGIAAAALDGSPARYTIGLYGPWGTGKSSLLRSIQQKIRSRQGENSLVVYFDAWRYEREPNLILPLLTQVRAALSGSQSWRANAREAVTTTLQKLSFAINLGLVQATYDGAGKDDLDDRYVSPYESLATLGSTPTGKSDSRIVVLIDDLDRCSPDLVVSAIEAIHLLTDMEGFVFVLALDYGYLTSAIRTRYNGVDADRFIEKIVQIPFHIPQPQIAADRIGELIDGWIDLRADWFEHDDDEIIEDVARYALRSNPRQIKRLLNSFMLTRFMKWTETTGSSRLLLGVIGLQLAWPVFFTSLHRAIRDAIDDFDSDAVDSDAVDGDESARLRSVPAVEAFLSEDHAEQDRLAGPGPNMHREIKDYLEKIFPKDTTYAAVGRIMSLTRDVVETAAAPEAVAQSEATTTTDRPSATAGSRDSNGDPSALLDELTDATKAMAASVVIIHRRTYTVARLEMHDRKVVFATFFAKKGRVDVQLHLDESELIREGAVARGQVQDLTGRAHLGTGNLLIQVKEGDEASRDLALKLTRWSLEARAKWAGIPVESLTPDRDE